jgi:hypothetical protein
MRRDHALYRALDEAASGTFSAGTSHCDAHPCRRPPPQAVPNVHQHKGTLLMETNQK